jgi:Predicted hydrolase (metallo-beta-lactamase superfamily)
MEAYGCTVSWDPVSQEAIAVKGDTTVAVPIGENYIYKNGVQIPNDTTAQIKDNRTYLPIRSVLEAFGANVSWNPLTETVIVSTDDLTSFMTVHFLDVGQADSIFIDYGDYEILVDGGNNSDGDYVVNYIKPYVDGDIELVVATHAHEDHVGGLDNVISAFQVDQIIYSGETSTTEAFQDFFNAATSEPNCTIAGDSDLTIDMGDGAQFKILEMGDGYRDSNENSVVSMIDYHDIEVLLMGDLETTVEKNHLSQFSDIDVLKVGHHGSRTATSQEFLDVVKPEVSIISAGIDNKYLLPNADVISRLLAMNSSVYGTFRSGNIVMTTDGYAYSFNTDINLTANDAAAIGMPSQSTSLSGIAISSGSAVTEKEACYIGNSSTKKFHTLSCDAGAKIADRNVIYFKTREDAVNGGYVPCKICNP